MSEKLPADVRSTVARGDMLDAVKKLRAQRVMGLKEAKDSLEAWQRSGGTLALPEPQSPPPAGTDGNLPEDVIDALRLGRKVEAIRRLRSQRTLDLKAAKELVEAWAGDDEDTSRRAAAHAPGVARVESRHGRWLAPVAILLTFVWALVNSVGAISAVIILLNVDDYRAEIFVVESLIYRTDDEGGLIWGLAGRLGDGPARYLDPTLADGKKEGAARLSRRFPPGTRIHVWVNRSVTDTLFQGRSIQVLPGDVAIRVAELGHLRWWLLNCLLPFALAMAYAAWSERRERRRKGVGGNGCIE